MKNGREIFNSNYERYEISHELKSWIHNNITDSYLSLGISFMHGTDTCTPHTDTTRDLTLMYIIDTGGKDVWTVFWKEDGQPLRRPRATRPDYDHLMQVDRVRLEAGAWYILDATVIHSVENMTGARISIQMGFDADDIWASQQFKNQLG